MSANANPKYQHEVREIANKLKPQLIVAGDTITTPDNLYESTLEGTDLTMDVVKAVQDHRNKVVAGFQLAAGETAVDYMKTNTGVDVLTAEASVGMDTATAMVRRSRSFAPPPTSGNTEPTIVHGDTTVGYRVNNGQDIKHVREHLKSYAAALFAS